MAVNRVPESRGINAMPILVAMAAGAVVGWLLGPTGRIGSLDLLPDRKSVV